MTRLRTITPHSLAVPLVCSEFRRGRDYSNWRPRGSGDWLLIYTVAGAGVVVAGARQYLLGKGDVVLFQPGVLQDYSTERKMGFWHLRWAHFVPKAHWQSWLLWPQIAKGTGFLQLAQAGVEKSFALALERMLVASRLGGKGAKELAMNALEEALVWSWRSNTRDNLMLADGRIRVAIDYLASHLNEPFSLSRVARGCGLSVSRFSHLFQRDIKTTPRRFAEKLKLGYACELLAQTRLSVGEIARETGFLDPLHFSRRFKLYSGCSPVAYRRK